MIGALVPAWFKLQKTSLIEGVESSAANPNLRSWPRQVRLKGLAFLRLAGIWIRENPELKYNELGGKIIALAYHRLIGHVGAGVLCRP